MTSPVQYTSRTFATILADLNSDPSLADKPDWWKRVWAGVGDALSMWENATANNLYLRTAFTRRAVMDLCQLIGYTLTPQVTASGLCFFDLNPSAILPQTFSATDLVATSQGTSSASARRFEARVGQTVNANSEAVAAANWNPSTDIVTVASGNYKTGEKVRLSTTGALPTGLSANTDYFVILVTGTTIKLASTRANAYGGVALDFTAAGSGIHTLTRLSFTASIYQQSTQSALTIGTSDGTTPYQSFLIPTKNILQDTITLTINEVSWTRVDSFINSGSAGQNFRAVYNNDGTLNIDFGDGVYGAIPPAFPIIMNYAIGGGATSNVAVANSISAYSGSNTNINGASNPSTITGGADPETLQHAVQTAPMLLKARDRFVTTSDGVALVVAYGGFSQASVIANGYGPLTAQVVAVATGGGSPGSALRTAVATYLQAKSLLASINVHFDPGTFTAHAINATLGVNPGYSFAGISPYVKLAFTLFLASSGYEIYQDFLSNGIAHAVSLINAYYGSVQAFSFAATDYAVITAMLNQFATIPPRAFGDTIQLSQVLAFVQDTVPGVSYINITGGTTLPYVHAAAEISEYGTVTLAAG